MFTRFQAWTGECLALSVVITLEVKLVKLLDCKHHWHTSMCGLKTMKQVLADGSHLRF